jgi:phospholipid transport system substrate-binding protein
MKKLRQIFLVILLLIITSKNSIADDNSQNVEAFVHQTSQKVMSMLQTGASDQDRSDGLTKIFVETMDIDWMGKFVVGKYWRELSEKDKNTYLDVYKRYLISSYIPLFKKYHNQSLNVKGVKNLDNGQYTVTTEIKGEQQKAPYTVEYRVKSENNTFKVRDVIAEGVSLITTQRADFGSILSSGGIGSLETKLEEKMKQ